MKITPFKEASSLLLELYMFRATKKYIWFIDVNLMAKVFRHFKFDSIFKTDASFNSSLDQSVHYIDQNTIEYKTEETEPTWPYGGIYVNNYPF